MQPATSFPGFSPTHPTERERGRVGENPGNEVAGVNSTIQETNYYYQCAKKVLSDSLGLVFVTCQTGKWSILRNSNYRRTVKPITLIKKSWGLVEMTFGLVNASFSLPEWQAVKMTFFAPWLLSLLVNPPVYIRKSDVWLVSDVDY